MKINKKGILAGILTTTLLLSGCNKTIFDINYKFNKVLILGDNSAIVLNIKQWKDYSGEQLQLNFKDNTWVLTSFVNTTLVSAKTDGIEEIIAAAFSGNLENNKGLVKKYE